MTRGADSKVVDLDAYRWPASPAKGPMQAADAAALVLTGLGALSAIRATLNRMRRVAALGTGAGLTAAGREALRAHLGRLAETIGRLAHDTELDGMPPLDGSFETGLAVQLAGRMIEAAIPAATAEALGLTPETLAVGRDGHPATAAVDRAIELVTTRQVALSGLLQQLDPARGARIFDPTAATEATRASRAEILHQPEKALVAQAQALDGKLVPFARRPSH